MLIFGYLVNNYLKYNCDKDSICDCCCVISRHNGKTNEDCLERKKQKLLIETAVAMLSKKGSLEEKAIMTNIKTRIKNK